LACLFAAASQNKIFLQTEPLRKPSPEHFCFPNIGKNGSNVWKTGGRDMSRTVLVTGATRGIGREMVKQLCAQGFTVFATGRDPKLLDELRTKTGCLGKPFDLAEPDAPVALYAEALRVLGRVDVLINNAGLNPGKVPLTDVPAEQLDLSYAVNLRAPFLLSREALKEMGTRKSGHILNVVSTIARTSAPNYSTYCSLKYAFHGFTQCLIKEARRVNVKVTGVYPGGTDTDFRPEERPDYLKPESAAKMIVDCINAPADVVVHELVYRPMVESNF
jgi:NAD(P)-dependent dehydrogenase (short-subunit alcohol dehydrogenase family)